MADAGFVDVEVEVGDDAIRFAGRVPTSSRVDRGRSLTWCCPTKNH